MTTPRKLGKYELEPVPIGEGGMAVVYKGRDPHLGQPVAIKVILRMHLEGPRADELRQRFKTEAIAGQRLRHPNIVPVYAYGERQDCPYIVMKFVEGKQLKKVLDDGYRYSVTEALSVMEQLLEALDYAHSEGVVHRDIKPSNILYGEKGRILVADFGIAKVDASTLTRTGIAMGTYGYMAPEQCLGTGADHRADIFAAGVILYQLLTGERPFHADSEAAVMYQTLNVEPVKPSDRNGQIPLALDGVVAKAMAKRREERYQLAREFASALKQAVASSPSRPGGAMESMPTIPGTVAGVEARRQSKISKKLLATAGIAGIFIVLSIWFLWRESVWAPKPHPGAAPSESAVPSANGSAAQSDGSPSETASFSPEALNRQLGNIVASVECAELESTLTAFGEVVLSGYLKPEDRERVEREIGRLPGVKGLLFKAETLAWPYCELRRLLGPYETANDSRRDERGRPSGVRLTPRRPDGWYQEGERLVLTLTAPDLDSHLYVDYFMLDGSVVHQFPVTASQQGRQPPFKDFPLGEGGGARQWQVAPPFGSEMLVAIAAQDPLFDAPRPEMDASKDYLPALTQALQQARTKGSLVLADLQRITTSPATQADKAVAPVKP
jgi:serine/threonine-protein kinase